jgi:hypothetical protein
MAAAASTAAVKMQSMDSMVADLTIAMAHRSLMGSGKMKTMHLTSKQRGPTCTADAVKNGIEEYGQEDRRNNP